MTKLSWTPKEYGGIFYCSPACGGGCTMAAYEQAKDKAMRLAARLGKGWKPRVWENLGWHYSAVCGKSKVRQFGDRKFWASLYAGRQFTATAATPRAAVLRALKDCDAALAEYQRERNDLRGV